ncbi:MAG: YihY/virulence factor BrkB family protein [Rhodothermales bacterium]
MTFSSFLAGAKSGSKYYLVGLYNELTQKDIFLWAQAIAFKVLVTIVPIIVLATGVAGRVLLSERPFEIVSRFSAEFLPIEYSSDILKALQQLQGASGTITLVGLLGLLLSAITLFTTLRIAVGNVFQEEWHVQRSIVRGYAFDFRMVLQVGLFFVLTIALTISSEALRSGGVELLEQVGLGYAWLTVGWQRTIRTLGLFAPFMLTTLMFFQLLYFVPKPHPPKRSAFIGALVTSVLWEGAKSGFTLYASSIGHFDRYSGGGDGFIVGLGQAFGLILAFVFWVYFSGLLLCSGALVALLHEKRYRQKHPERFTPREQEAAEEAAAEGRPAKKREGPQHDEVYLDLPPNPPPANRAEAASSEEPSRVHNGVLTDVHSNPS